MSEFLIWSFQKQGWWKPLRNGYTKHVEHAARFSFEEACAICDNANKHGKIREGIVPMIEELELLSLPMGYIHNLYPGEFADIVDVPENIMELEQLKLLAGTVPEDILQQLADATAKKIIAERRLIRILQHACLEKSGAKITEDYFLEKVGRAPKNDDLERCNCELAGEDGHFMCGWCNLCDLPRFSCLCADLGGSEAHQ